MLKGAVSFPKVHLGQARHKGHKKHELASTRDAFGSAGPCWSFVDFCPVDGVAGSSPPIEQLRTQGAVRWGDAFLLRVARRAMQMWERPNAESHVIFLQQELRTILDGH